VMYEILRAYTTLMAPVLVFTAEEIWGHLPRLPEDPDSIHLASLPSADGFEVDAELLARFESILTVRAAVTQGLEAFRAQKNKSLDASVTVGVPGPLRSDLDSSAELLHDYFIVSSVTVVDVDGDEVDVTVAEHPGPMCPRCWKHVDGLVVLPETRTEEVEETAAEPQSVCARCAAVLKELGH